MKKAKIAEFKAKLSGYLKYVRRGETVTIYDRDNPIADVIPHTTAPISELVISEPTGDLKELWKNPRLNSKLGKTDSLAILLEDRKR